MKLLPHLSWFLLGCHILAGTPDFKDGIGNLIIALLQGSLGGVIFWAYRRPFCGAR